MIQKSKPLVMTETYTEQNTDDLDASITKIWYHTIKIIHYLKNT